MLKRLRRQFVCIIMLIVTLLLSAMMVLLFRFTELRLERQATAELRFQFQHPAERLRPGELSVGAVPPDGFILSRLPDGSVRAEGGDSYDLSDRGFLSQLYTDAMETGREQGVLQKFSLRFVRFPTPRGVQFIFADTLREQTTLRHLKRSCMLVGSGTLILFFGISLLLARWTVKPVEKAWQQQRQFVADASHELKTPLTVILTDAELLRSPESSAELREELLNSLLTMALQMRTLVERLLELARSDSVQHREGSVEFDLSALAEARVMSFEPLLFEAGLTLRSEIEPGILIRGRPGELSQVLDILLDNAGKYSASPGTVTLSLRRRGSRHCTLTVETPGEALSEEDCRRIFERFCRRDPARERNGSFGLGLSIARELVEGHRGKISAKGIPGGNRFCVEL